MLSCFTRLIHHYDWRISLRNATTNQMGILELVERKSKEELKEAKIAKSEALAAKKAAAKAARKAAPKTTKEAKVAASTKAKAKKK